MHPAATSKPLATSMGADKVIAASYDSSPYESFPFPQTAPEHLCAIAHLFGLTAARLSSARILELGCAAGGNLIPVARRHPGAYLVGLDLSAVQIEQGRAVILESGLSNVDLKVGSITEIDASWGRFDYIICHGVYSWVPPDVQSALLRVCAENLTEVGVAYVSYNTYPGWKFREVVRDAMLLGASRHNTQNEQLSSAISMLDFLEESVKPGSAMKVVLEENVPAIRKGKTHYLLHEYMEAYNSPCYFNEFLLAAHQRGLCYLAEAQIPQMFASNQRSAVAEPLQRKFESQVELEQHLDFAINRSFRMTLLVHSSRQRDINYSIDAERLRSLHFAGRFESKNHDNGIKEAECWTTWNGGTVTVRSPLVRAVALALNDLYPATCDLETLIQAVAHCAGESVDSLRARVTELVTAWIIKGHLRLRTEPQASVGHTPVRPKRSPKVHTWRLPPVMPGNQPRLFACNPWHETVPMSLVESYVLDLANGERDHAALLGELSKLLKSGALRLIKNGAEVRDVQECADMLKIQLNAGLTRLSSSGLFL